MPSKSQAQRAYLAQKFGPEWLKKHHFNNPGKLPQKAKTPPPKPKGKGK